MRQEGINYRSSNRPSCGADSSGNEGDHDDSYNPQEDGGSGDKWCRRLLTSVAINRRAYRDDPRRASRRNSARNRYLRTLVTNGVGVFFVREFYASCRCPIMPRRGSSRNERRTGGVSGRLVVFRNCAIVVSFSLMGALD